MARYRLDAGFLGELAQRCVDQPLVLEHEAAGERPAAAIWRHSPANGECAEHVVTDREDDQVDRHREGHITSISRLLDEKS
jgi:hypothetical protein